MNRDDAMRALEDTDWTGATVETEGRPVSFVYSVRIPADMSTTLEAEAERRGLTPSALIRELVGAGLGAVADDTVVTLRVADLRRAIDSVVSHAA
jgi:predicted DNA-binding protein